MEYKLYPIFELAWGAEIANQLDIATNLDYTAANGRPIFMPVKLGGVQLPGDPLVTVTAKKTIVETKMVGAKRGGTIKELISTDDYSINIKVIALNYESSKQYPRDEVDEIHALFKENESLEIESPLLNLLLDDNNRVVIKSMSLPAMPGVQHAQAIEINCVTDQDWELEDV